MQQAVMIQIQRYIIKTSKRGLTSRRSMSTSTSTNQHYDVTIVGGGAVGSGLANLLSTQVPSLKVALMETRPPRSFADALNNSGDMKPKACYPSARAYALSPKSLSILGNDTVSKLEDAGRIAYYNSMQVWESDGPAVLHFNQSDLEGGDKNNFHRSTNVFGGKTILGAVVEDEPMVSYLWEKMRANGDIDLISPAAIQNIIAPADQDDTSKVEIVYKCGESDKSHTLSTNLLIAADGGNSFVRKSLGTFPTVSYSYDRQAVTCTVEIDSSMNHTAFQRFQPNGPIALLPVWHEGPQKRAGVCAEKIYANIVWSTTPKEARQLLNSSEEDFVKVMNDLLQSGPTNAPPLVSEDFKKSMPRPLQDAVKGLEMLSRSVNNGLTLSGMTERRKGFSIPPIIKSVVGRRFAFDLNLMHAKNYVSTRVALVGDAAHTIHPMAGQGLNLGMGDAACIAQNLKQAVESGMGIDGSAGLGYALQQYESSRQREVIATMGGIQFLHGVFGTTVSPAVHARSVGMNIINSAGPIRRRLVKIATGIE